MPGFELIDKKEKDAVNKIFDDGGILFAHGFDNIRKNFHIREFEKEVSDSFNCNHALAVSSGTAAIKIGLKSLGVKPGDEVITQAFNFIATIEAILDCGAVPIISNVNSTLNMDPVDCEALINEKTKVLLPVHMLGVPCEMESIMVLAKKYNLKVLEDNCESIGARYNEKFLGTIGDLGALSFDFGKIITTGEGGMIITNEYKLDKYSREYHDHGHENNPDLPRGKDSKTNYGFNYRMTEMQAAVGKVQLKRLSYILSQNKIRYQILEENLGSIFNIRKIPKGSDPNYDTFIFFTESKADKNKYLKILNDEGIGTKNLPDAMEWHCTAFWNHALDSKQIHRSMKTKDLLDKAIAIPIWLRKDVDAYDRLGKKLFS